jgi:hypothetical protein
MNVMRVTWPTLTSVLISGCVIGSEPITVGSETDPPGKDDTRGPQPTTPLAVSVAGGRFRALTPTEIGGSALMVRHLDGKTDLSMAVVGVTPGTMYTAHLHAAPCEYQGGGHYKIDPLIVDPVETNELWLTGLSSDKGAVIAEASFSHLTRGEALSVVVHDPMTAAKLACADLREDDGPTLEFSGAIVPFADATPADMTLAGTIAVTRTMSATSIKLDVTGLDPAALGYGTHIHAEPCDVATGGGHYKIDPTVIDPLEANEIWPLLTPTAPGAASSVTDVAHAIRSDAQSFVIHRTINEVNKPKVACANLERITPRVLLETSGTAIALSDAAATINGAAVMKRRLTGVTDLAVVVSGLEPEKKYMAHVHNQPCAFGEGGGHYKFDNTITEAVAENEIWFDLTADADGAAHDSIWVAKLTSAAAQSLVVHGDEGVRLACFELK